MGMGDSLRKMRKIGERNKIRKEKNYELQNKN